MLLIKVILNLIESDFPIFFNRKIDRKRGKSSDTRTATWMLEAEKIKKK